MRELVERAGLIDLVSPTDIFTGCVREPEHGYQHEYWSETFPALLLWTSGSQGYGSFLGKRRDDIKRTGGKKNSIQTARETPSHPVSLSSSGVLSTLRGGDPGLFSRRIFLRRSSRPALPVFLIPVGGTRHEDEDGHC